MADKAYRLWSAFLTVSVSMLRSSALESYQCALGEFKCLDGMCVLDETFCNNKKQDNSFPNYVYVLIGIFGFLVFGCLLLACYKACTNDSDFVNEPPRMGFKPGRILPPESRPAVSNHLGTSSNYQSTHSRQYEYTGRGYQRLAPGLPAQGTHGIQTAMSGFGPSGINSTFQPNRPAMSGFGPAGINSTFQPNRPAMSGYRSDGTYGGAMATFPLALT